MLHAHGVWRARNFIRANGAAFGGIDVSELLSDELVENIETQALETMEREFQ